jgi:site-specific DNA-adenine methylase
MNDKLNDMNQLAILQDYLKGLYEAYDVLQKDYRRLHKRSKMHEKETVGEYYLRWRDKMRKEIRHVENLLIQLLPSPCMPCIDTQLKVETGEFNVEIFQLQIVDISQELVFHS